MWREKWLAAYEQAGFYDSRQNTVEYWNQVAQTGFAGLSGKKHIEELIDFLKEKLFFEKEMCMIDIGCGCGDYTIEFAKLCGQVTANDSSPDMLQVSKKLAKKEGIKNISFVEGDYMQLDSSAEYDLVLAALNPATYSPMGLEKLMELSKGYVIYMSMDTSLEGAENEPVYRGTNSVQYAENYLKEKGIFYEKLPYVYVMEMGEGQKREIPFAYLLVKVVK